MNSNLSDIRELTFRVNDRVLARLVEGTVALDPEDVFVSGTMLVTHDVSEFMILVDGRPAAPVQGAIHASCRVTDRIGMLAKPVDVLLYPDQIGSVFMERNRIYWSFVSFKRLTPDAASTEPSTPCGIPDNVPDRSLERKLRDLVGPDEEVVTIRTGSSPDDLELAVSQDGNRWLIPVTRERLRKIQGAIQVFLAADPKLRKGAGS